MAYGLSDGHMIDDVKSPWKVKLIDPNTIPICLERNI